MRNLHLIGTDKPSWLIYNELGYGMFTNEFTKSDLDLIQAQFQNIYITNDEEIKEGDWFTDDNNSLKRSYKLSHVQFANPKKIIITDNKDLIKDGVQAIPDEFLEWFIQNQSCERVEVNKMCYGALTGFSNSGYKIIIPKKEQNKQMYSEEDMREAFENGVASGKYQQEYGLKGSMDFNYFIEQFKNK